MTVHYRNLTNGLCCGHNPLDGRYVRLQSTWCEQKRWADVLTHLSPDLLIHVAFGEDVVVHDRSEKRRLTRACWQGLSWVRFACRRGWDLEPAVEVSRGGQDMGAYWAVVWDGLDRPAKAWVRYFRRFATGDVQLSCCEPVPWHDLGS